MRMESVQDKINPLSSPSFEMKLYIFNIKDIPSMNSNYRYPSLDSTAYIFTE